jgi:hypothetical protein
MLEWSFLEVKLEQIDDDVLGTLTYRYGWVREYEVISFGEPVAVRLTVPCGKGSNIEDAQRQAFAAFDKQKDSLVKVAEEALFKYYEDVGADYRKRLGSEFADKMAPLISSFAQLKPLVRLNQVVAQRSFSSGDRVIGLLFSCSWEPELGAAVRFVNEEIEEVGTQDIVI